MNKVYCDRCKKDIGKLKSYELVNLQINDLKEYEEYGEIEANIENIEYSLRFKAPEDTWNYVYDRLIINFIPPETEIDYKVLSIWTMKSTEELKEYNSIMKRLEKGE